MNEEVHDHETLGTKLVGEDLDSVPNKETRPSKGITNAEEPDEGNDSLAGGLVSIPFLDGATDRPADEADQHAGRCCEEKRSSANSFDKEGTADRDDEREDDKATVDAELRVGLRDAD